MNRLKLKISGLLQDGRGLGFLPAATGRGKAVFVAGALPGQEVACSIQRDKGSFAEANLVEVLQSDWEPQNTCSHWEVCGGCPLMPLPCEIQLVHKERLVLDVFERIGGMEPDRLASLWHKTLPSPRQHNYRNKVELAFGNDGASLSLGFRKRRGHDVVSLENCRILPDGALPVIHAVRELAGASGLEAFTGGKAPDERTGKSGGFLRFLILRKAFNPVSYKPEWGAILITSPGDRKKRAIVAAIGRELIETFPNLGCFIHEERKRKDFLASGERRLLCLDRQGNNNPGAAIMALPLGGKFFRLDAASFFQVNSEAADLLARTVMEMNGDRGRHGFLLDLYCGVGAPGLLLAPFYEGVYGVEHDARSVNFARRNAADFAIEKYGYRAGDAGREAAMLVNNSPVGRWSTALLDPPRSGLSRMAIKALVELAPENIIHISCDSATMARDAAILGNGWELARLGGLDMFPHTPHLECCGLWRRR